MKGCLGGTFDTLHKGHKYFLEEAFKQADSVLVGIASDELVEKMGKEATPYFERFKRVKDFLDSKKLLSRAEFVKLNDPIGPAGIRKDIDVIFCTKNTRKNAIKANDFRFKHAIKLLKIVEIPLIEAEDRRELSVSRIKKKEIDEEGKLIGH